MNRKQMLSKEQKQNSLVFWKIWKQSPMFQAKNKKRFTEKNVHNQEPKPDDPKATKTIPTFMSNPLKGIVTKKKWSGMDIEAKRESSNP